MALSRVSTQRRPLSTQGASSPPNMYPPPSLPLGGELRIALREKRATEREALRTEREALREQHEIERKAARVLREQALRVLREQRRPRRSCSRGAQRMLACAVWVLPDGQRDRWAEELTAELFELVASGCSRPRQIFDGCEC
jgi:hypothetical protein